uniref:uncharacterized protein LOC109965922 isoform X3 n=1 Tax=Monopterus albus TaxID=43700 RepID=UPI0009B38BA2|nr:uncharacterized protein LOC109965922 isoform X3 [Monopterus albus]
MATKPASVLITGANRGLGLEMVKQMVERYHSLGILFACCRDPDRPKAEGLKTLASKYPNIITVLHLDVTDLCSIKTAAQQVGSLVGTGGLNLLINNAGILLRGNLQDTSPEDMHTSFNTNVVGPMNIIKEFQPLLKTAAKASGIPGRHEHVDPVCFRRAEERWSAVFSAAPRLGAHRHGWTHGGAGCSGECEGDAKCDSHPDKEAEWRLPGLFWQNPSLVALISHFVLHSLQSINEQIQMK